MILAITIALAALVAIPRTAHACICRDMHLSEYKEKVHIAFAGRQIDWRDDRDARVLTLEVDRVYKGEAGPLIEVYTPGNNCATDFGGGYTGVVVFMIDVDTVSLEKGDLYVHYCGSHATIEELREVFGAGYPPDPPPVFEQPAQANLVLIFGGALVVLAAGAISWRRRRQRPKA